MTKTEKLELMQLSEKLLAFARVATWNNPDFVFKDGMTLDQVIERTERFATKLRGVAANLRGAK